MRPVVLLVEDAKESARLVFAALDGLFLELLHVDSIASAKTVLSQCKVSLVLLDQNLPDGTGVELIHWGNRSGLAQGGRPIPFLVYSSLPAVSGLKQTSPDFVLAGQLIKPVGAKSIRKRVTEALSSQGAVGTNL
ncbi:MAG: response regulator [Bdellovibrionales bacterium]